MDDEDHYEPPPLHLRYRPATIDEAARHLVDEMSEESRGELRAMEMHELDALHWELNLDVCNHYILEQLIDERHITPEGNRLLDDDAVSAEIVLRAWVLLWGC